MRRISSDLNFRKIYFLITQASRYRYQQIPGNSMLKFFATKIHGESHPISMYLTTQYFSHDFSRKRIASETT